MPNLCVICEVAEYLMSLHGDKLKMHIVSIRTTARRYVSEYISEEVYVRYKLIFHHNKEVNSSRRHNGVRHV